MTRRSKPYQVTIEGNQKCRISAYWFHLYVAGGWLVRIGKKSARLRDGVVAWVEGETLRLQDRVRMTTVSIPSSWRLVERWAIYDQRGERMTPERLQREICAQYCVTG